ncbi:MAG TPA: helix-turn-helix domain-containing protein [Bryobacteraceae bacterium]|nr:helix-turn-helix domain-containing protein [Bryobacteraceae bacterium]
MGLTAPKSLLTKTEAAELVGGVIQWPRNAGAGNITTRQAMGGQTPEGQNASEEDTAEATRRFDVIEPLIDPAKHRGLHMQYPSKGALIAHLSAAHQVKPRTIYHWLGAWERGGFSALVPRDRSDKGVSRTLNRAAMEFLLAAAMPRRGAYGVLSAREIFRAYEEERVWRAAHIGKRMGQFEAVKYARYLDEDDCLRPEAQLPQVAYQTIRRALNAIPEAVRTLARRGEEAFHASQEIISFRDLAAIRPMEYVVMDHRVLDIFCLVRDGRSGWKLARPWLTAAIDMRTRKWLAWVIVETPSSDSIAAVLKRLFLDHGLPENCYWDNGKDFRCEWLEGRHIESRKTPKVGELEGAWKGVLGTLGVRVHHAIVKRARAKIIEPNFGRIAKFDATLPEYCGHKPAARPEGFARLVEEHEAWAKGERDTTPFRTIQEIAALYNDAIEDLNERPLEGEGMRKVTATGYGWWAPNEAWEVLIRNVERRAVSAEVLHFAFAKRKELTVKHGEVKTAFAGRDYHYRLTGNPAALMALNGEQVEFAFDPLDLGDAAIYFQSRFIGLAHCVELRKMGADDFQEDERLRRAARREVKRFITAVHNAVPVPSTETRLARRRAVAPSRENPARPEASAQIPAAIAAADAAAREEKQFDFQSADVSVARATQPARPDDGDDSTFHFFSQGDHD